MGELVGRLQAKSLYRSCAGRHFYGTENVIWPSFGPVGNSEKKIWADYEQLLSALFSCLGKQIFLKHGAIGTEKLHNISFIKTIFLFVFGLK